MDESKLVVFTLTLSSIHLYGAFLPPVSTLALEAQSEEQKQVIRESEYIGTAFLLGLAGMTAYMSRAWWPLLMTALMAGAMFATYEYALARVP